MVAGACGPLLRASGRIVSALARAVAVPCGWSAITTARYRATDAAVGMACAYAESACWMKRIRGRTSVHRSSSSAHRVPPPLVFTAAEALGLVLAVLDGSHAAADADDPAGAALGKIIWPLARPSERRQRPGIARFSSAIRAYLPVGGCAERPGRRAGRWLAVAQKAGDVASGRADRRVGGVGLDWRGCRVRLWKS